MSTDANQELLTPRQTELLQHLIAKAMQQASQSLANVLNTMPEINTLVLGACSPSDLPQILGKAVDELAEVTAVRQAFFVHNPAESFVIFNDRCCEDFGTILGYPRDLDRYAEAELNLDLANMLVGVCVTAIMTQLGQSVSFTTPSFLAQKTIAKDLFNLKDMEWKQCLMLMLEIRFEEHDFACYLMNMCPEESLTTLCNDLDRLLERNE